MKKLLLLFILTAIIISGTNAQKACCPIFDLKGGIKECRKDTLPVQQEKNCDLSACKNVTMPFVVFPNEVGYTYTWTVTGGTATIATSNPINITFGNTDKATIQVVITNADGSCRDTLKKTICLLDAPKASFTSSPSSPVCNNTAVQFTNTSIGGNTYFWNFGDGTTATDVNPASHIFPSAGTYNVVLTVSNGTTYPSNSTGGAAQEAPCGCKDTFAMTIIVKAESGVNIIPGCKKMLCKGDTANYCTTATCSSYNWSLVGGTIIGSTTSNCVDVKWDGSYPAIVTLNGNCGGSCGNTASLAVPVLYPTMPIVGSKKVCPATSASYSLPSMPGAFYGWHLSGGGYIVGSDSNVSTININWGNTAGTYYLTCYYKNPTTGCSGIARDTIKVLPKFIINPSQTKFCIGNTFSFTSNGNASWTIFPTNTFSGNNTSTINGNWNSIGSFLITATPIIPANYCNNAATIQIKVNDTPKLNSIVGPIKVCKGSTNVYAVSSNMADGIFNWNIIGGTIVSQMGSQHDSVVITWGSVLPYNLSVTQTVNGCTSSPKQIAVDTFPKPIITGNANACPDTKETYTVSGIMPTDGWNWSVGVGGSIISQTANTIQVLWNGNVAGANTSFVSVTMCSVVSSYTVTVNTPANVIVNKSGSLCTGKMLSVTGSLPCYQWYRNGMMIAGATSPTYTATLPGNYEVRCPTQCSGYGSIVVPKEFIGPPITVVPDNKLIYCIGETINLNLNTISVPSASCTFQWYKNGLPISGGTSASINVTTVGTYYIIHTCGLCKDTSNKILVYNVNCGPGGQGSSGSYQKCTSNFNYFINCNTVTLTNLSSSLSSCPITSYKWSCVSGGSFSSTTAASPVFTATVSGTYNIQLIINTSCGCADTFAVPMAITILSSSFTPPVAACVNEKIDFSTNEVAVHYYWNFGDGSTSALQNTSHTYLTDGTFSVSLEVTNNMGCKNVSTHTITIYKGVTVSAGADKFICPNNLATLTATGTNVSTYQWYNAAGIIGGATSASYASAGYGTYYVIATSANGCTKKSNPVHVYYKTAPIAKIKTAGTNVACMVSGMADIAVYNSVYESGTAYSWTGTGPSGYVIPTQTGISVTLSLNGAVGTYQIILTATNANCTNKDTLCVKVYNSPTVTVSGPAGPLCQGPSYTFVATASPTLSVGSYIYLWTDGTLGNTIITNQAGLQFVQAFDTHGCVGIGAATAIQQSANVSLFPIGCDTLCLTDTVHFPLPLGGGLSPSSYNIQWYDSGTPIGTNSIHLPLALIGSGDHHFSATVTLYGQCPVNTGIFDVFVKDCTLSPPCDNCPTIFDNANFSYGSISVNIMQGVFTFTSKKPLKEVRINVADLKYHWDDPSCKNCKAEIKDRACIYPANASQTVGNLVWNNFTGAAIPPSASSTDCPKELIFKLGVVLPAGTYSIPLQVSFAAAQKNNCKLVLDKFCMHLAITDEECKICEKNICSKINGTPTDSSNCGCSAGNNWTNLFITQIGVGIPKPKTLIFCNSSITGYNAGVPYLLSGMYNCKPGCVASKYDVIIRNQTGDIIYTHVGAALYENILFPIKGIYTVSLAVYCGDKKCECKFQIVVGTGIIVVEPPHGGGDNPTFDPPTTKTPTGSEIEKVLTDILPPDFSGQILVAKKDSVLYEKYKGKNVNNHTAFDLASVAKTFTAMAILKMAEEKKINLSDDLTKYLPSFPTNGISIKMLLSHTSGLDDYLKVLQASSDFDKSNMLSNADLLQYIVDNKAKMQVAKPGSGFSYSNTNFAMLALVIEKISGLSYGNYLSSTFFKPLKMEDTYVFSNATAKTATPSYYKNGKAYDIKFLDFIYGDKNIYTTVKDMMKWDKALRDGKIFNKESIALAYTPSSTLVADQSNYGLGWRILLVPNGKKIIYHNGWWHGNRSVFIRLLDEDAVIVILSNSSFTSISNSRKLADLFGQYKQTGRNVVNF